MWYWVLNIVIAFWVFFDARNRKMDQPVLWAIGTCLLMIIVIPFYFAKRSLKDGEEREGGTAWNVLKFFAIFWTVFMFVGGVSFIMTAGDAVNKAGSGAEQAGAVIGTAWGMGMIIGLWFIGIAGALIIGLFVKKSSIVEKGPTGALASELSEPLPEPDDSKIRIGTLPGCLIITVFVIICGVGSIYFVSLRKNAPKETKATVEVTKGGDKSNHVTQNQIAAAQGAIQNNGYKCDEVNEMLPLTLSEGFTVYCNDFNYEYELKDVGGNWEVTVK